MSENNKATRFFIRLAAQGNMSDNPPEDIVSMEKELSLLSRKQLEFLVYFSANMVHGLMSINFDNPSQLFMTMLDDLGDHPNNEVES
jgi:hypothetical protein